MSISKDETKRQRSKQSRRPSDAIVGEALRLKARTEKEAKFQEIKRSDQALREEACAKFGVGDTVQCGKYAGKITEIRKDFNVRIQTRMKKTFLFSPVELTLIAKAS